MWLLLAILLLVNSGFSAVYEIVEPDMLAEIEAKKYELAEKIARENQKIKKRFFSYSGERLISAEKNYTYYIDPTYTLQADIPKVDREGNIVGILYPKGYKFNPLDFLSVKPPPLIVFNACDDREIAVVKRIIKERKLIDFILVSAGCSIKEIKEKNVSKLLNGRIYMLTREMKEKFKLKNTISFIDLDLKNKRIKVEVFSKTVD